MYSGHEELSDADFDAKWKAFFADPAHDARTIRRGLNDVFAYGARFSPLSLLRKWLRTAIAAIADVSTTIAAAVASYHCCSFSADVAAATAKTLWAQRVM